MFCDGIFRIAEACRYCPLFLVVTLDLRLDVERSQSAADADAAAVVAADATLRLSLSIDGAKHTGTTEEEWGNGGGGE